ncbi:MAG: hypothetical protein Q7K39_00005, partial [Candidatus Magasanikbacteria bacterium]|nr:hypothetical protein [Candidatus Magasanikbacteria bacterium]
MAQEPETDRRVPQILARGVGVFVVAYLLLFGFLFFQFSSVHAATPPTLITYQGKMLNSSNFAITTTVAMKFVLYSAASGGTALYTASGTLPTTSTIPITPTNGLFSINLGDTGTNSLDPTIFQNNQTIYLEVTIAGETLSPRKQITASPFAFNAKYLDGVAATSTASTSTYIPISDSSGNFSFNTVSSTALKDALGWILNQGQAARLQNGVNNSGFGSGATPSNLAMTSTDFSFFNMAAANASAVGFIGGVFDGRYIYMAPYTNGQVARYDTTASFSATSSYSFFDIATNVTSTAKGFEGSVFDGRYVYFIPLIGSGVRSGTVVRYDTAGAFTATASWAYFDTAANVNASSKGFVGGVFDGRYLYLVPFYNGAYFGQVTRYDTTGSFTSAGSWSVFDTTAVNANSTGYAGAVFDGQYIYFVPNSLAGDVRHGQIARFDTTQSFTAAGSWSFFNTTALNSNSKGFTYGATFDGRYIYFSPLKTDNSTYSGLALRYDTAASFSASSSYSFFDATTVNSNSKGFNGTIFDGRYLYYIPDRTANGVDQGQITRYDTTGSFVNASSWSVYDMAQVNATAKGFTGAVFDGHYIYFVPFGATGTNGLFARQRAYAGGLDSAQSVGKIARGSELYIDSAGNVGINDTSPPARLTVTNGAIMASGTTGATPGSGAGTRLMWIPAKAAFRAGAVSSTEWDDANIGINSTAFGLKAKASGRHSLAWGVDSVASSDHTLALGELATASGVSSIAINTGASSSATYSMAMGWFGVASGIYSTAIGGIQAQAYATSAMAIGNYAIANASGSMAFGNRISVSGENSFGIGVSSTAYTLSVANTFAVVGGRSLFGTITPPTTTFQVYVDGGSDTSPGLGVRGYIQASGFITASATLDLAEQYPIDPACYGTNSCPEEGDAVCVVPGTIPATIEKCDSPYSKNAIGIVSTNPGFTLGGL